MKPMPGGSVKFSDDTDQQKQARAAWQKLPNSLPSDDLKHDEQVFDGGEQTSQDEQVFDGGEQTFTVLLCQLALLHRRKLQELSMLSVENERLHHAKREDTDAHRPCRLLNGALPSVEPCSALGQLRNAGVGQDHLATLEVESVDEAQDGRDSTLTVGDTAVSDEVGRRVGDKDEPENKNRNSVDSCSEAASEEPFELRHIWSKVKRRSRNKATTTRYDLVPTRSADRVSNRSSVADPEPPDFYKGSLRRFIAYPASRSRVMWDVAGAVLIFWDLLIIPLNISALAPQDSTFLAVMDWITLIFWTLNIPASLMVGYVKDGVTIMHPLSILINYLKTWFVLDLIVVVPDWVFTLLKITGDGEDNGAGSSVKLLRILRLVRCVRLLRLARLKWIIASINDLINSEYTSIVANISKMLIALLAITHFLGCAWFLVADLEVTGPNWVRFHGFDQAEWTYQYFTSFHWALTQFTPSSMHVQPQNLAERGFAITVVVFGLVGFSYLVGSITGSLTELRRMNSDMAKQFWNLRRYLNQNNVPTELSVRIQKYLEHQWQLQKTNISRENVMVLKFLSEQLNNELSCAIAVPNMLVHPLFDMLQTVSFVTMQRLATNAISRKQIATGDSVFFPLETATEMSFVIAGRLQYIRMTFKDVKEWVDRNEDWIAEPVLWTPQWQHRGQLIAASPSDLLLISAQAFGSIIQRNPQVHLYVSTYAANFITWINSMDRSNLSDIIQGELCTDEIRSLLLSESESFKQQRGLKRKLTQSLSGKTRTFKDSVRQPMTTLAPKELKHLFS